MLVVESERSGIIDRRLEIDCLSAPLPEPRLDLSEQACPDPLALPMRGHIDSDNVSEITRLRASDDESDDFITLFGDQSAASARFDVILELRIGVCDVRAEGFIVYAVEQIEVAGLEVSNLDASHSIKRAIQSAVYLYHRAIDVTGALGTEKCDKSGEFAGLANSLDRGFGRHSRIHLFDRNRFLGCHH